MMHQQNRTPPPKESETKQENLNRLRSGSAVASQLRDAFSYSSGRVENVGLFNLRPLKSSFPFFLDSSSCLSMMSQLVVTAK